MFVGCLAQEEETLTFFLASDVRIGMEALDQRSVQPFKLARILCGKCGG